MRRFPANEARDATRRVPSAAPAVGRTSGRRPACGLRRARSADAPRLGVSGSVGAVRVGAVRFGGMLRGMRHVGAALRGPALFGFVILGSLLLGAGFASPAAAQTVTAVMTADRTEVPVGESFRLQIRADVQGADVERVDPPDLSGFDILSRQVSRSMQFRFGFGQQQQMVHATSIYTFVLRPRAAGRYDLPGAEVVVGGQVHTTNPLAVVVGGSNQPPPTPDPGQPPGQAGQGAAPAGADGAQYDPEAFLRTVVDEPNPYVGQQVTVTLYLYTRRPLRSAPQIVQEPTADGFWVHDLLPPSRNLEATRQVVGGQSFNVYVMRRFAAFPLREGELQIGAPRMAMDTGSLFDFFQPQQSRLERAGVAVPVNARALPEPVPAGDVFVGDLTLELSADRTQVRTGDAITLTLTARGQGNLRDVRPELPAVDGLRILQPQIDDRIEQANDVVGGTRTMEWLVVPEGPGNHQLPAIVIPTFDPATGRYGQASTAPLTLVSAGASVATPDPSEPAPDTAEPAPGPAPDAPSFGPIRRTSDLARATAPVSSGALFWLVFALAPALFLGVFTIRALRRRAGADPSKVRAKDAKKRLGEARALVGGDDPKAFYAEVARALTAAVEARIGTSIGGMTRSELTTTLRGRGMEPELVERIQSELEVCDFARFSTAGQSAAEREGCLERTQGILGELDRFVAREEAA